MDKPTADAAFIDIELPEVSLEPGDEKQVCLHYTHEGPDLAVVGLDGEQSQVGHHVVILRPDTPMPSGTVQDCSDGNSMAEYETFVLPAAELPPKHAILVPTGTSFVVQAHTINTSQNAIITRDYARLKTMPVADVEQWATTFATGSIDFKIAPQQTTAVEFDCTVDEDAELLFVGGHMHEFGSRFEVSVGPDESNLKSVYLADPWKAVYRDLPPVTLLFDNPITLPKGTVVRTVCEWTNPGANGIEFPQEMCGSFGYVRGRTTPFNCEASAK